MPLGDRLERHAVEALAGRRAELVRLEVFALGDEPLVVHIQGIPGIGKTHLLNALAASIGGKGVFVVRIDARWCEPSPAALCRAISNEVGASESEDPAVVATSLSDRAGRTLLVLDSYESFRLLDSWLRQVFLPSLSDSMRTILSSCEPPRPAWRIHEADQVKFLLTETDIRRSRGIHLGTNHGQPCQPYRPFATGGASRSLRALLAQGLAGLGTAPATRQASLRLDTG